MKRILFITNRNILTTCGELRLIKNRAEVLFNEYGIATDFIAIASESRINAAKKESIEAGGNIEEYPFSLSNMILNIQTLNALKKRIITKLRGYNYSAVILSGVLMPYFAKTIRANTNAQLVIDIHGAQEDLLEVANNAPLAKKLLFKELYKIDKNCLKRNLRLFDSCFVVTDALKEYLINRYEINSKMNFYKIPCATANTTDISESAFMDNRAFYRKKYGISNEDLVFIYSGGASVWQCVQETIDLYSTIEKEMNKRCHLLVFSHDKEKIEKIIKSKCNVIIDSYLPDELRRALCCGDYAFLLRKDNLTNNVAFPNKFLEYIDAGMRVISTPYVYEIKKMIIANDLGYIYDLSGDHADLVNWINNNEHGSNYTNHIKAKNVIVENSFSERLKPFAESL